MPQHALTPNPAKLRDAAAEGGPGIHVGLRAPWFSAGTRLGPLPAAARPLKTRL